MIGSFKWILLTIVGGILSVHTIETPSKQQIKSDSIDNSNKQSYTNDNLGLTIEHLNPLSSRQSRNLVPPYQEFSTADVIQYVDKRSKNSKNLPIQFGQFRYQDVVNVVTSSPAPFTKTRRSDEDEVGTVPASRMPVDFYLDGSKLYDYDYGGGQDEDEEEIDDGNYTLIASSNVATTVPPSLTNNGFQYKIIPINLIVTNKRDRNKQDLSSTTEASQKIESSEEESGEVKDSEHSGSEVIEKRHAESRRNNIKFPDSAEDVTPGRRSGVHFPTDDRRHGKNLPFNPFVPPSYSEDSAVFGEGINNLQRPYNEDEDSVNDNDRSSFRYYRDPFQSSVYSESESINRPTRIEFPTSFRLNPFKEEVTKFGDINGPITAIQRPIQDFSESRNRSPFESTPTSFYTQQTDSFRPSRHYFPPKAYTEYGDYSLTQSNSKYYQPPSSGSSSWKNPRQPRVIFPPSELPSASGTSSIYVNNENVVFR